MLSALFGRYDLERSGRVAQESFLAAAQGSTAAGRAVRPLGLALGVGVGVGVG